MKKIVLLTAYCSLLTSPCFGSGYEFEGVGARQTARAGAAVADSDDWTAIYWNPANLAKASQTKKREIGLELFGGMAYGKDSNSLSNIPGVGAIFSKEKLSSPFILGAIGGVLPVGEKMGLGLGFYTPLLQGSDFEDTSPSGVRLNLKNSAAVLLWTASSGLQMTPELALGAGLNVMYGKITTKINLVSPIDTNTSDLSADGWGVEGMLGLRYDPHPKLSLGFAYRTGADIHLEGPASATSLIFPNESTQFKFSLNHPPTTDIGLAFRPQENWTLTADLHQTYWSRFSNAFDHNPSGLLLADTSNTFNWRNTWKLKFGLLRKLTEKLEILAGYSFDRHALDASSTDLSTSTDASLHRFSAGASYQWKENIGLTLGALAGSGKRTEGSVHYQLSGWQMMAETKLTF